VEKLNLKDPENIRVKRLLSSLGYRKGAAYVHVADSITLSGGYWDGGSRKHYHLLYVPTNTFRFLPCSTTPVEFGGGKPAEFEIQKGYAVIVLGVTAGKTSTASIYLPQASLAMLRGETP
jgi:hypothetical protein